MKKPDKIISLWLEEKSIWEIGMLCGKTIHQVSEHLSKNKEQWEELLRQRAKAQLEALNRAMSGTVVR